MTVHRIRLVGPWDFAWQNVANETPPEVATGRVTMPIDWQTIFGLTPGTATFSRRFHRPTNLEPHERVMIVFTGVGGTGSVSLNGSMIAQIPVTTDPIECDVTNALATFNVLEVSLSFRPDLDQPTRGGLFDAVVLEIRNDRV